MPRVRRSCWTSPNLRGEKRALPKRTTQKNISCELNKPGAVLTGKYYIVSVLVYHILLKTSPFLLTPQEYNKHIYTLLDVLIIGLYQLRIHTQFQQSRH